MMKSIMQMDEKGVSPARTWELVAWTAGVFSLLVGLVMVIGHLQNPTLDPLNSPELKESKARLKENPTDEATKQRIRDLDLQLRTRYFRQLSQMGSGTYLLLGAAALFILAVVRRSTYTSLPPMPKPRPNAAEEAAGRAVRSRWSVAAGGTVIAGFLFVLSLGFSTALPRQPEEVSKLLGGGESTAEAQPDAATADEMKRNWPMFRGYEGAGFATVNAAPENWDTPSGAGVAWKTPSPCAGFNSPLIWGNKVFLSGGDAELREVVCLDLQNGQTLWRQAITNVPGSPTSPPEIPESTGYAAPSMATDGRRVYVIFANGDLAGLTMDGNVVWRKGFGALKNPYGHATSLTTWRDRVIVQLDQGEPEDRKSKLYAIDGRTGRVVWQKERKVGASWASPIAFDSGGKGQIVTLAVPSVMAYAAADGADLWQAEVLYGEITPSPVYAGGQVIVASPSDKLVAIRPDGLGEIAKSHIVWTNEDNVPDVTSPASNGELVFALTTAGMLSCFDAKDGKKQWEHDYEFECHASPTIAAGNVYFIGEKGVAVVVEAARQFKELFRTEMGDDFHATPAFAPDKMVLRGVTNVWCLNAAAPAKAP
jgi:outer membrane protein assembly factor BamB